MMENICEHNTIDGVNNITILGYITSMVITISIFLPPYKFQRARMKLIKSRTIKSLNNYNEITDI